MFKKRDKNTQNNGINKNMLRRAQFLMAVCGILAFVVLGARLYKLQIIDHEFYETAAIEQQTRDTSVSAARGTIYDTNGNVLAISASVDNIYISPIEIAMYGESAELIASGLSEILDVDYDYVYEMTQDTSSWYKTVARKVEADVAEAVRAFKDEYSLSGVKLETDTKRYYPNSDLAAHIIGFVGTDNTGLGGIEAKYDEYLSGEKGNSTRTTTASGTEMLYTNFEDYYDATQGSDITLTIDSTIQYYVEKQLEQAVLDYDIQNGAAAIVMEVDTGAILAMVSLGDFDLNNYQILSDEMYEYIYETAETEDEQWNMISEAQLLQWRNKAISDTYEPGSVFKILTLSMGLNEGVIDESSTFYCDGDIEVIGRTSAVKCWKTAGHGSQTLEEAVEHSCNVAFVQIGQMVGAEKFYSYCEAFGLLDMTGNPDQSLTASTGIDLSGESGSIWWSENVFYNPSDMSQLAAASFGQTFTITPLQLITAVSACVNGGYLMQPYVVSEIRDQDGNIIESVEPTVVTQVISEETSAIVCSILEQVVGDSTEGTGRNAYVAGYKIGGKTGTSEKVTYELETGTKQYIVSFLGVAPADDPEIAILVLLDNPSDESGIYVSGGQMAAPVVGKIFADVLPYMGYEPDYTEQELELMDKWTPNVVEMTLSEAIKTLEAEGLSARIIGDGDTVTMQLPSFGNVVAAGSEIILYAEATPSEELEVMIDLENLSYEVARERLAYYGLFIKTNSSVTDASTQYVSWQSVDVGELIEHGTVIEVELMSNDVEMLGIY